jgi:hypothetical protein
MVNPKTHGWALPTSKRTHDFSKESPLSWIL